MASPRDAASWDWLLVGARVATMAGEGGYGLVEDGAVAVAGGDIAWVGPRRDLPPDAETDAARVANCRGGVITPGLVDCHTHLVFGGNRAGEFEQRLNGISYAEIARRGGGIAATVKATRAASEEDLLAASRPRLDRLVDEGVTTVEIKSGYGLETETELKMLRVARTLGRTADADVRTTFLGAHAVAPEYRDRRADYVDLVCGEMMPRAADEGLCDAVDAFCESIGFTPEETDRVFAAAADLGLPVKLHAEQLSNLGGARLAARHGALSADHLEYLDREGADAMVDAGTVGVLLPGAFYFLQETRKPPVALLREAGVPIAIATDLNPGSSPVYSILAVLNLSCLLFGLTPVEALAGVTSNAARALGLADRGTVAPGLRADLAVWDVESPGELAYRLGYNPCRAVIREGVLCRGEL